MYAPTGRCTQWLQQHLSHGVDQTSVHIAIHIVGNLLRARAAVLCTNWVTASIVYHPENQNLLTDDAYR